MKMKDGLPRNFSLSKDMDCLLDPPGEHWIPDKVLRE